MRMVLLLSLTVILTPAATGARPSRAEIGTGTGLAIGTRIGPQISPRIGQVDGSAPDATSNTAMDGTYRAPLSGPITLLAPFRPPARRYGSGHLGVDLAVAPGTAALVFAAAPGRVSFAGQVAGRGVVVIMHADGVSTEYEPVRASVTAGTGVVGGQLIGTVTGLHHGCRPSGCLHWGARRGADYLDPLGLLVPLGPVRLLPWS